MKKIVVQKENYELNKLPRFQHEIFLESGVEGVFMLTAPHLDGKDIISFRRKDIPDIVHALLIAYFQQ